jgi:hypothetical protein
MKKGYERHVNSKPDAIGNAIPMTVPVPVLLGRLTSHDGPLLGLIGVK